MDTHHHTAIKDADHGQNLDRKTKVQYSRIKRKILRHVWLVRSAIIFGILAILFLFFFGIVRLSENLGIGNIYTLGYNFLFVPVNQISQQNNRTNILVMGKAGGAHEGPDLTDTMLLISLGLKTSDITIVSIPRDLWMPDIRAKINSAYYWGKQKQVGGIAFAKTEMEEVVGSPVNYGIVVDFSSFKDIVDALGGIQVDVANSFTDKLYPIAGKENDLCDGDPAFACRYESVTFNAGLQTMNGDTALIFVRSRHAEGVEGTDIAREARQQKVIDAIKNKIMDPKVFLSVKTDLALFNIVKKYVETDIDPETAATLARIIIRDDKKINQYLIPDNLLFNPPINKVYDQQYVFVPAAGNGNWTEINKWFQTVLQ